MISTIQIQRRNEIVEAYWEVEESQIDPAAPVVVQAGRLAVHQLEALLRDWDPVNGDAETGVTYRYLGDAYFSASARQSQVEIERARQAYLAGEACLQRAGDELGLAKLNFNLANTLLFIEVGNDHPYYAEARRRYQLAYDGFRRYAPAYLPMVAQSIQRVDGLIASQQVQRAVSGDLSRLEATANHSPAASPDSPPADLDEYAQRLGQGIEQAEDWGSLFQVLRQAYQAEVAAGKITPERQQTLEGVMDALGQVINNPSEELADKMAAVARVRGLLGGMGDAILEPSRAAPVNLPTGSRPEALSRLIRPLFQYVLAEQRRPSPADAEADALGNYTLRFMKSRDAIAGLPDDAHAYRLETESLRRLALDVRQYALRNHLTLARPAWGVSPVTQDPNALLYSGGEALASALKKLAEARGFRVLLPESGRDPAELRWSQLQQCSLAVFDLTAYERSAPLAAAQAAAPVFYELGICLSLGRPVVILARQEQAIPFDVDIEPLRLSGMGEDLERLGEALDQAVYTIQRGGKDSSLARTLRLTRQRYEAHPNSYVRITLAQIKDSVEKDPLKTAAILDSALAEIGTEDQQLITPAWPGDYPELHEPCCFHVTAFGPSWAAKTMQLVSAACPSGMAYIRGDQVLSPDIIRSIWDEICRASHVVVDLTGLNANVLLELGMAHTLGRSVLLLTQDASRQGYPAMLAKQRLHRYSLEDSTSCQALSDLLQRFLKF
jgi:hypothetical protein